MSVDFEGLAMSSNPNHPQPVSASPKGKLLAALSLIMVVFLSLAGCNPKPDGNSHFGHSGGPKDKVTVFFSKYQGSQSIVENVERKVPPAEQDNPLEYAVQELLEGPTAEEKEQGFYSEIPKGTKLLGMKENNDTVTINLSSHFTTGGGSTSIQQRMEEVKQTVYSVDSHHKLNLAVEGQALETLGGEGLEVPGTLEREGQ